MNWKLSCKDCTVRNSVIKIEINRSGVNKMVLLVLLTDPVWTLQNGAFPENLAYLNKRVNIRRGKDSAGGGKYDRNTA